jgi:hypothetical protein
MSLSYPVPSRCAYPTSPGKFGERPWNETDVRLAGRAGAWFGPSTLFADDEARRAAQALTELHFLEIATPPEA